ncbi:MAG TPA: hypothetical protein VEP90_01525 [Methylomirabilota bacterium]|nr:hypothetical protein [Methylomirabilota bacterium]
MIGYASEESKKIDKAVKNQSRRVALELGARMINNIKEYNNRNQRCLPGINNSRFTWQHQLYSDQIPGLGQSAIRPDGGAFFIEGHPVLSPEGKYQKSKGNANNRVFRDIYIFNRLIQNVDYVLFCTGEGVRPTSTMYQDLCLLTDEFNVYKHNGISVFLDENGFSDEIIYTTIKMIIENRLK